MVSRILSLRSKGECSRQLLRRTYGRCGPGSGRTRWRRGRWAARCGGDEAALPGAPGTGAVRAYPRGAGKARATRYLCQGPELYPSLGSTAQGTEKKKEDLAGKRGAGAG